MQTNLVGRAAKAKITERNPKATGPSWNPPPGEKYWVTTEQDVEIVGAYCSDSGPHLLVLTGAGKVRGLELENVTLAPLAHPFR